MSRNADVVLVSDPANLWDAYCNETPAVSRSPQGAMAFAFGKLTIEAEDMDDFIRAVLADNNPRSDEPFATVAKWIRKLSSGATQ